MGEISVRRAEMAMIGTRWQMQAPGQALVAAPFEPLAADGGGAVGGGGGGVCHTDLGFFYDGVRTNHPLPLCLGHEISGRVVAAGGGAQAGRPPLSAPP